MPAAVSACRSRLSRLPRSQETFSIVCMDLYELNYKALDLSEKSAAGMPHDEYLSLIHI